MQDCPEIISADAAYDAQEIRQYNWKRGRPVWFDPELYKKHSAFERFFSWLEAFKKIVPRYEQYAHSFLELVHLACSVMIRRILG